MRSPRKQCGLCGEWLEEEGLAPQACYHTACVVRLRDRLTLRRAHARQQMLLGRPVLCVWCQALVSPSLQESLRTFCGLACREAAARASTLVRTRLQRVPASDRNGRPRRTPSQPVGRPRGSGRLPALPPELEPAGPIEEALARAEAWVRARRRNPAYQLGDEDIWRQPPGSHR
jgi:hypothetical protein